jgi:DNA-binding GntR family transcriptional regulator
MSTYPLRVRPFRVHNQTMDAHEGIQPLDSPPTALRRLVVQRLLAKIIRGELGPGTRLIASSLAYQLGVSATPVREALVELEQSGVVELAHHRGAAVNAFGRGELRDFYHVRCLLQCDAVRLACGRVAPPQLDALCGELHELNGEAARQGRLIKDVFAIDLRIRRILVDHCGNKWLVAELGRYDSIEWALRGIVDSSPIQQQGVLLPAAELAAALRSNDAEACACAMQQHVGVLAGLVEAIVFHARP